MTRRGVFLLNFFVFLTLNNQFTCGLGGKYFEYFWHFFGKIKKNCFLRSKTDVKTYFMKKGDSLRIGESIKSSVQVWKSNCQISHFNESGEITNSNNNLKLLTSNCHTAINSLDVQDSGKWFVNIAIGNPSKSDEFEIRILKYYLKVFEKVIFYSQ